MGAPPVPAPPDALPWHALPAADVLARLETDGGGLDDREAAARLARHGPNRLRAIPPTPAWKVLLAQLRSVVVLLLAGAAAVALLTGDPLDAAAIAAVLLLNTTLGFVMELRARRSMEALGGLEVPRATVVRGGAVREVPAESLVPGDVVVLEAGARVPADARLLSAAELRTAEAALTGESLPVDKSAEAAPPADTPLAERGDMVYLSTLVVGGTGRAVVVATGMRTEVGRIGGLVGAIEEEPTPLERRLDELGRRLAWVAVGAAALVAGLGWLHGAGLALVLETAVALAIAAVPEGLPAVATIALAVGVRRMARRHALVRRLPAVESLGSATVVCTDKTGTLTAGEMTVVVVWAGGREVRVGGTGYAPEGGFLDGGGEVRPGPDDPLHLALRSGALANRAALVRGAEGWSARGDPTEAALLAAAAKAGIDRDALLRAHPEVGEVPFSSERMLMATFHGSPGGVAAYVKGAPAQVLARCDRVLTRAGEVPLDEAGREEVRARNAELAARGLRVLALARAHPAAGRDASALRGLTFVGLAGMMDPPAPGVRETVAKLREAGLRTVMLTGDQRLTAAAVARELGVLAEGEETMDGRELDRLDDRELAARVGRVAAFSRVSPEAKLRIVSALRRQGEIVAMLGDGVNDAAALKRADIGVAMGGRGTDAAREASGVVLRDDRFPTVAAAVEEGRIVFDNIRKFVFYLFSCNLAEVLILLAAGVAGLPLPLLPLQILWLNLVTDTFPALALAVEPGDADVMRRPPRDPGSAILSPRFVAGIALYAGLMTAVTLAAFLWGLAGGDGARAVTLCFTVLCLAQVLHLGNARSRRPVLGRREATSNPFALGAAGLAVGLQLLALYWPPLARLLGVVPLAAADWAAVLPLAAVPAVAGQLLRLRRR
ncbi:MAG TPA: HAD-IC family P-type ATPase [Longimicrobiaceae bacterium]